MIKPALALLAPLLLAGCVTYHVRSDGIARAGLGETVMVGMLRVTPRQVLEDSRCPAGVRCVWAGRVRLAARIGGGSREEDRELTMNQPVTMAGGSLALVEVTPGRVAGEPLDPKDYRFGFSFTPAP